MIEPIGVSKVHSSGGGVTVYLKKKLWLRVYHAVMLHDVSPFLLDPFGNPVSFNRADKGDNFLWSYDWSCQNGYSCSLANKEKQIRVECSVSLSLLVLCPWVYRGNTPTQVTRDKQFRIGREKEHFKMRDALAMLR